MFEVSRIKICVLLHIQVVRCTLTGHEMPLYPETIQAYVTSKRYTRLLGFYKCPFYQKYKQFFADCSSKKRKYVILYSSLLYDKDTFMFSI